MRREGFFQKGILQVALGAGVSLLASVALVIAYAFLLRVLPMGTTVVTIVTQVLKGVALSVGVMTCVHGEKGWLKGGLTGLFFSMLGCLTFSSLGGGFSLSWLIVLELAMFVAVGGLMGVLAVNVKKG